MAETDTFPVDADYVVGRTREATVIAYRAASGETIKRRKAPSRRVFNLAFHSRPGSDWELIENFRLAMAETFFDFHDKSSAGDRHYSCEFGGEPTYNEIGNDQFDISVQLVEACGVPLDTYPSTPLIEIPTSQLQTVSDGKVLWYAGYGYKITGSGISDVELDDVSLGVDLEKFDVPLLTHKLKIQPAGATVTKLEVVH
jgi:hypothetical protein